MKKILGLDLGTASIGWAYVNEAENKEEKSSIIKLGSRIIHYGDNLVKVDKNGKISASKEPEKDFLSGKGLSPNADRTKKRSARRNLQRLKLRKENLIEIFKENNIIEDDIILSENENRSTFQTYENRANAASDKIDLEDFAKVLLMINKKRGYKSSRKANNQEEGQLIDGMEIAKQLYENNLTPGQFVYTLLKSGKNFIPDFYRSDLQTEFNKVWDYQMQFYPEILTNEFKEQIVGKGLQATANIFLGKYQIYTAENKEKNVDKRIQAYKWRTEAISNQLKIEEVAYVIAEINKNLANSSGYLGAISDRSKELFFNKLTVGQYLWKQITEWKKQIDDTNVLEKPTAPRLKSQVFYRQDYLDEFERIWEEQAKHYLQLTPNLKEEIRDVIIFFQRRLKSQKGLISFCEFESKKIEVVIDGKKKIRTIGSKVCPKSSPLFQEFKIWQILNNIEVSNNKTGEKRRLEPEEKAQLFEELNFKDKLTKPEALKLLFKKPSELDLNYEDIEGNKTNTALVKAYQTIIEFSGHGEYDFNKMKANEILNLVKEIFIALNIKTEILKFDSSLEGKAFEHQPAYQLWHLLYSYEDDNSPTGNEKLLLALKNKYGFEKEYANIISNILFQPDYGSLSTKAIRKILPHLKDGNSYDVACTYAGYNHSNSLTKEEKEKRTLKDKLEILPKNSLRNPVVEKILNQMINVINTAIDEFGKPDEIRVELARELKKNAKERKEMSTSINTAKDDHEKFRKILQSEFGLQHVSRNDVIRYKLYKELEFRGYKTFYTNTYIPAEKLFSKEFDIEHIIPQTRLFDNSFSNKTLEVRVANIEKADETAYDYVKKKFGEEGVKEYLLRIEDFIKNHSKKGKTKYKKLLMKGNEIPDGFIERDIRDTQYIAKKAKTMLEEVFKEVTTTTGSVTERLRSDWQLIDVMQELNWEKYKVLGLTEEFKNRDGNVIRRIKDWTKRNDHRHHAMDALTVAFTKRSHVQYLNNLNARSDKSSSIYGIEQKELYRDDKNKLRFKPPIPLDDFRAEAKKHLENTLVSFKAKNKVVTKNKNITKINGGHKTKIELTPRGQLHLETVYGSIKQYKTTEMKVGGSFDAETINKVANKKYREVLLKRLIENHNDSKKAFTGKNSLDKKPIYLDELQTQKVPEKIKFVEFENIYTIRKDISSDLKIEKVIDVRIRKILEERLKKCNNDAKKAFSNLDENPIWLNKEKGICIKRVTISGISNAEPLHYKKDKDGKLILNEFGKEIPVDFVNTGNNHHVAFYRNEKNELQEKVVSFYEAVERVNQGLPVIDKTYKQAEGWTFLFSMKKNEYFVFPNEKTGFNPNETDLLNPDNYYLISPNLFRVQKFGSLLSGLWFRHHLETNVDTAKELKGITYKVVQSLKNIESIVKVRINHLGKIVKVGE
ncbi:MAG: type II CRISPR RNA-guided endonuclease Cas9 [Bacteroidia bacterium]|nr:type II CRISPR RNA-guided endonuclease Cas9 [Bacteroidia bacterium]